MEEKSRVEEKQYTHTRIARRKQSRTDQRSRKKYLNDFSLLSV